MDLATLCQSNPIQAGKVRNKDISIEEPGSFSRSSWHILFVPFETRRDLTDNRQLELSSTFDHKSLQWREDSWLTRNCWDIHSRPSHWCSYYAWNCCTLFPFQGRLSRATAPRHFTAHPFRAVTVACPVIPELWLLWKVAHVSSETYRTMKRQRNPSKRWAGWQLFHQGTEQEIQEKDKET